MELKTLKKVLGDMETSINWVKEKNYMIFLIARD